MEALAKKCSNVSNARQLLSAVLKSMTGIESSEKIGFIGATSRLASCFKQSLPESAVAELASVVFATFEQQISNEGKSR